MTENERREITGAQMIETYARESFGLSDDQRDTEMVASDLIADILHGAVKLGANAAAVMERAQRTYDGDAEDDEPQGDDWQDEGDRAVNEAQDASAR